MTNTFISPLKTCRCIKSSNNIEENELSYLTTRELKDIYRIYSQPVGSNKDEIIASLVEFKSAISNIDTDNNFHVKEEDTK